MNAVVHMCLCALVAVQICGSSPTNSSVRTSGIPNWTKKILKLQPNPVDIGAPPPYMLHLYNRYRKGRLPYSTANTVRSFLPIPGKLGGRDILVFNLTGVHATEYIERADLHLHSKRQLRNSRIKRSNLRLSIVDLSRFTRPQVDNVFLTRISAGWHTVEITDSVISCLDGEAEDQRLMGLLPHADEDAANLVDLSKLSTLPFLVVFSEDDEHLAIGDLEERSRNLRLRDFAPKNVTSEKGDRFKRELLDNELPDYPQPPSDTSAAEIQARLKHKPLDSPVLTYSKNVKGKSNNGKHRKRRRRRRRKERRLPVAWGKGWWKTGGRNNYDSDKSEEGNPTDEGLEVNNEHICQRRKLVVDLSEIGWSAWIISPSSFDAYYCSGLCSFPLPKTGQPTNHATIQSLVHSLGLSEDVPNPCCVPESLAPLTMLFFDQDRNVVLKSYPSMTVENCVCR